MSFGKFAVDWQQRLDFDKLRNGRIERVNKMMQRSIQSFKARDTELARSLRKDDEEVDKTYIKYVGALANDKTMTVRCALASTLVLRYLERIADHACYIGDSVVYIVTGTKAVR